MVVPITTTSAPPTAALTVVAPAICKKVISPAISALMPSTPLGVAMTSTSKPCFLKMPASRANHGTAIDPDSDVIATRSLRSCGSAASESDAAKEKNMKQQTIIKI